MVQLIEWQGRCYGNWWESPRGGKMGRKINIVKELFLFSALKTFLVAEPSNRKYNI
jgi:hypothetical protein